MNWHSIYLHWPDHKLEPWPTSINDVNEYDFYTDEFTEQDEREWDMANGIVQLERQNENNKKWAPKATFVVQGDSQSGAVMTVNPGGNQIGASVAVTMTELGKIADQIDKVLGRKPRKEDEVKVRFEDNKLVITGLFETAAPF